MFDQNTNSCEAPRNFLKLVTDTSLISFTLFRGCFLPEENSSSWSQLARPLSLPQTHATPSRELDSTHSGFFLGVKEWVWMLSRRDRLFPGAGQMSRQCFLDGGTKTTFKNSHKGTLKPEAGVAGTSRAPQGEQTKFCKGHFQVKDSGT